MDDDIFAAESRVSTGENPWPVSRLSSTLKEWIQRLGFLWVEGELAQIKIGPTNMFGELRDLQQENSVSIHAWELSKIAKDLRQGDRVVALIKPDFWPKGGKLTMRVVEMRKVGLGELLERIERLRAQLVAEGLTAIERKQQLPFLPNCIGLITGKDSDAEKDVLKNALARYPNARFKTIHTLVQGDKAAPEIIQAIRQLDDDPEVDVIIIARGGGAFLDLLVFSDEGLVRAAAAAKTPIISAIGHENDRPLLDDVADWRAVTPTDAGKKVVPDVAEELAMLRQLSDRATGRVDAYLRAQSELISHIRSRPMLANPYGFVEILTVELATQLDRLRNIFSNQVEKAALEVGHLRQQVRSLSPQSTLDRGYSIIQDSTGAVITDSTKVAAGTKLKAKLAVGELSITAD